jgi:hypothetical protein
MSAPTFAAILCSQTTTPFANVLAGGVLAEALRASEHPAISNKTQIKSETPLTI